MAEAERESSPVVVLPRGVADPSGSTGFVQGPEGSLVALDLASGALLWRHGRHLRPLLCANGQVVAACTPSARELELIVVDAENGREIRRSASARLPEWAHASPVESPEWSLRLVVQDPLVVVNWVARSFYKGGAAATRIRMVDEEHHAAGSLQVELDFAETRTETAHVSNTLCSVPPTPEVLEQTAIGETCYQFLTLTSGQSTQLRMRAVDQRTGRVQWETVIGDAVRRRPGPLRK